MELRSIRYFLYLARTQHMSRAAEDLNISQPALSKTIKSLEEELQVKLFTRTGNRIHLNENGVRFYDYAVKSMALLESGVNSVRSSRYNTYGTITVENWVFSPIIGDCIAEYLKINPLVNFNCAMHPQRHGADPSFLIRTISPELMIAAETVRDGKVWFAQQLFTSGYVLIMSKGYMDIPEGVTELNLSVFRDACFIIHFDEDYLYQEITYSYCSEASFFPRALCKVEDFMAKMALIRGGVGVAFIPEFCLAYAQRICPDLRSFKITNDTRSCSIGILRNQSAQMNEAEQDFWDFVMDFFEVSR